MKSREFAVLFVGALLLIVSTLAAACGGGDGLTLEEYFQRLEELGQREAVDEVSCDERLVVGVPGEVDPCVPVPKQPAILLEQGRLIVGKLDAVCRHRGGQALVRRVHGSGVLGAEIRAAATAR